MLVLPDDIYVCDMHIHTDFSDGSDAPGEAVRWAADCGMKCVAVTDHDDVRGVAEACKVAEELGMEFHTGVEFSADYEGVGLHILGYDIDIEDDGIRSACKKAMERRRARNEKLMAVMEKEYGITVEDIKKEAPTDYIGKPHMAAAMIKHGAASSKEEVFEKIFSKPQFASIKKEDPKADEVINVIKDAGGTPVLAHPGKIRGIGSKGSPEFWENFENILLELMRKGLEGLECVHKDHRPQDAEKFISIANRYGFVVTRGSDHHG